MKMPDMAFLGLVVGAMALFALVLAYESHVNK
jgi:hypothetical protein